jgi:transcriptional regulator with XRE-family HTH domain
VATAAQDLAYIRQFAGLSDEEVARLFGASLSELRGWLETDRIPGPTAERIRAVAEHVRRSAADPTRLGVAHELTAPREELGGRSVLERVAEGVRPEPGAGPEPGDHRPA